MNSVAPLLTVDVRRKSFPVKGGEHQVLQDVRFALALGEILCLFGPSGCGKSSLLRLIAALDLDFEGVIRLVNASIEEPTMAIGMTVQMHVCYDWLNFITTAEIARFWRRMAAGEFAKLPGGICAKPAEA